MLTFREQKYHTLKVCVRGVNPTREISISDILRNSTKEHGKNVVRMVLDQFELTGPDGKHTCLLYQPLGMSFSEFQDLLPGQKFPKEMIQRGTQLILIALAFMHEHDVIHTG